MATPKFHVNDDESLEVAWFPLADLPPLTDRELTYLTRALKPDELPLFAR